MPSDSGAAIATVADAGEHALIERIRRALPVAPDWLIADVGDDAAIYEPPRNLVEAITTDAVVDGVHVDRRFVPASAIGHRVLAVNLSDLAAMGATPRLATLSLMLPADLRLEEFDAIVDGALTLAERSHVRVVGGNITRTTGPLAADVTAIGAVHRRKLLRRSGVRPGDYVFVSGVLGDARAGLAILQEHGAIPADLSDPLVARYLLPEPRLRLGTMLGRTQAATAAIDLSDGLADGVQQLAAASGVGVEVESGALPISDALRASCLARDRDPVQEAVAGGDDYELLFTVHPRRVGRLRAVQRLIGDLRLTRIGVATRTPGVWLMRNGVREPIGPGFVHFS